MNQDNLYRYLFENADVRGELVQLEQSFQDIVNPHQYPVAIKQLLGELLAATTLLTATLKFKGDIGIQLQGDGPVSLAVINGNNEQQMRGIARYKTELPDSASLTDMFGKGYMVITITPEEGERYQGVVALDKPTLAQCLEEYFAQSEQLPTKIWLFTSEQKAGGMLLQVLPSQNDNNEFEHLAQLTSTITANELLDLPAQDVLHRLYHQEQVRLFDPIAVSFNCTCSRQRSADAIRTIDKAEIDVILAEKGKIEMGCEYCNSQYEFDGIDIEGIYANHAAPATQQ